MDKYIFVVPGENLVVAMDHPSGGYPHETDDFMMAHVWYDISKAMNYYRMFHKPSGNPYGLHDWELKKLVGLNLTDVD